MPPDTHDQPARRHEGVLVASAEHPDPRVETWVGAAADRAHKILTLGAPLADMITNRSGAAVAAITLDDLCPPADPTRLVRRSLQEGFAGLSIIVWADSVIAATSSDQHAIVETALADLCDHQPVSVLCCYARSGAGTDHLDMAVAHHDDGLHEQQLTVHRIEDTMKLDGEIDVSNLDVLVSALRRMTRTAAGRTVRVDLTRAGFLSVGAAQALAQHTAAYRDHGGHLELLGVTPQLTRTLQLLQLHPLTEIAGSTNWTPNRPPPDVHADPAPGGGL
jgi:anti-anti-sigma factor